MNDRNVDDSDVVTALQSFLIECTNYTCRKNEFEWKKHFGNDNEFHKFLAKWSSVFGSDQSSVWLQGMAVRDEGVGKKEPSFLDLSIDFDSSDDELQFEVDSSKKAISKSVDEELSSRKSAAKRHGSQSSKYVPPKVNVKMPAITKVNQAPQKAEEEKRRLPRQQQSREFQQQQQQQQHHGRGPQVKIPVVAPPTYMHNLDKQPMTNREKFMSYKVQRLETKLEKTTAQLQKFRAGYQNLVNQLTCPICMEPSAKMSENRCCSSLCCERCALLKKECPNCHKPTQWVPSPVVTKISSTLKTDCPFGCGEDCSYSDLEKHKSVCLSALVSCPHPLCSIKVRRRHLEKHLEEECAYRAETCDPKRCVVCATRNGLPLPSAPSPQDSKGKEEQRLSQETFGSTFAPRYQDSTHVTDGIQPNNRTAAGLEPAKSVASSPNLPDSCNLM